MVFFSSEQSGSTSFHSQSQGDFGAFGVLGHMWSENDVIASLVEADRHLKPQTASPIYIHIQRV
jgi:hypothetical protein